MSFYNYCRKELKDILITAGHDGYRADQMYRMVYKNNMSDKTLPKAVLEYFNEAFSTVIIGEIIQEKVSKLDGTQKLLIQLDSPKHKVETVLIREMERNTVCLSSQVGCSLSCSFCHTGTQKLLKNLSTADIISQFMHVKKNSRIDNVVFMGQGEPLYNWRNVSRAVRILTDPFAFDLKKSKITISTSGVAPLIPKIASELGVNLAVSLHAASDSTRSRIMSINETYNLKSVLDACEEFAKLSKCKTRRISFEYVMLRGINDSISQDASELVNILKHLPAHINLIPFNKWPGSKYECSNESRIHEFNSYLNAHGIRSTIRWSKGDDILAACGQLRSGEELKSNKLAA